MYVLADPRLFNLSTRGVTPRQGRLTSLMVIGRRRAVEAATAESGTGQDNYCLAVDPPTSAGGGPAGLSGSPHPLYRYQEARCGLLSYVAYWYSAFGSVPV